jgi:hypothetical protein
MPAGGAGDPGPFAFVGSNMAVPQDAPLSPRPVRWPIYVVVVAAVVGLIARFVFVAGVVVHYDDLPPSPAAEEREGVEWSFRQLFNFLRERDLPVSVYTTNERAPGGPIVSVGRADELMAPWDHRVNVQRCPSMDAAHRAANAAGGDSFAWGRFFFQGNGALLTRINKAVR